VALFLNASPDSYVLITHLTDSYGHYLLVYSKDEKKGVVLDVEKDVKTGHLDVRNIGFGTNVGNGEWSLYSESKDGTKFESEGGLWTLHHFATLLTKGLKQRHQAIPFKDLIRD
jgi:hypothetical protein